MSFNVQFMLKFDYPVRMWVLQIGGWLPVQFPSVDVMLVDRNITSALQALHDRPKRTDMEPQRWWLSHLNTSNHTLNPILCASEGKTQKPPTYSEFCTDMKKTCAILQTCLPKAKLIQHDSNSYGQLYEVVLDFAERQKREIEFLLKACPFIAGRIADKHVSKVEQELINAALSAGVSLQSFVFFAVLSVLYEPISGKQPMIGRGLIKPKAKYSERDAYNATADIRHLEWLAIGNTDRHVGLCTRDRYMAAFWVSLRVSKGAWGEKEFSTIFSPTTDLFPRLDKESSIKELLGRLERADANSTKAISFTC